MSVEAGRGDGVLPGSFDPDFRIAVYCSLAVLTASYGRVLYHVTDVVGGAQLMLATLVGSVALGVAAGWFLRVRTALVLTALFLGGGFVVYFLSVPESQRALLSADRLLSDTAALLTGLSVLRLTQANVWALSVAPTPVFLSWYLAVRRRYVGSVAVGGAALSLVVLTGDAGTVTTLAGVAAAAAVVGFGTLDRHGGTAAQVDTLVILLAAMVVVAATLSVVPATRADPVLPDGGSPSGVTSLVNAEDRLEVIGSISLSPQVQFTVESRVAAYWTTSTYDRYTGSGWVRSGDTEPYAGQLRGPPSGGTEVEQTVTAETEVGAMPATWRPVAVEGLPADRVQVTAQGTIRPTTTLDPNESYTVTSRLNRPDPSDLRVTGDDYPDWVVEQYTQLPASTPERVAERTRAVTAGAETPYEKAVAIESYLESNKRYSLTVDRPEGSVADAFLFEMDAGYCTYYATAMVTMLRTEGVPARFVTGYTTGERVGEGKWVVRGLDSHAWVQVYLPETGWVRFDPTPVSARESAEFERLVDARESGEAGVDTEGTLESTPVAPADGTESGDAATTPTPTPIGGEESVGTQSAPAGDTEAVASAPTDAGPDLPSTETLVLWGVVLVGVGAAVRRTGAGTRAVRAVWLRRRGPRRDPDAAAVRAFERLVYLLECQERPRRTGETPRAYVERVTTDDRTRLILRTYERARYGDGVGRVAADAATDAVGELVRERTLPTRPFVR
ncbi:transglutaminase TgpA family protein [Haloplanus pelagicus]|uniref:transglutaminase TgpA family protein n=1 Tax=Haloplanus pelagicus TaxID=2949995 RepID=UPI00203E56F6|nr:transglutaminaseTgpA domain-containing protein [Haloplanus sp. HW8-1]